MASDPHDLQRFVDAQRGVYPSALAELQAGRKLGHWMWFVFPQIAGLGRTSTAQHFAISGLPEARAYWGHELLASRLVEVTEAMNRWTGRKSAVAILGEIDAMKFRSSMTLFEAASPEARCFAEALNGFFEGERDSLTLERI